MIVNRKPKSDYSSQTEQELSPYALFSKGDVGLRIEACVNRTHRKHRPRSYHNSINLNSLTNWRGRPDKTCCLQHILRMRTRFSDKLPNVIAGRIQMAKILSRNRRPLSRRFEGRPVSDEISNARLVARGICNISVGCA